MMRQMSTQALTFRIEVDNWNRFTANTGGTLVEKCCHFFDLMRRITGCNPLRVFATGGQVIRRLRENTREFK